MMKKWIKRLFVVGLAVLLLAVGLAVTANVMRHKRPDWYPADAPTAASIAAASQSVKAKFAGLQGWAAGTQAKEVRQVKGTTGPNADPDGDPEPSRTITLTDAELNAFFSQWDQALHWGDKYSQYVTDPILVLQEDRIILAGSVKEVADTIVSVHLEPSIDEQGKLRLRVARVMGGRLPLPRAFWSGYVEKLSRVLQDKIDQERRSADIAADGSANIHAVSASMNGLLLHALNDEAAEAVIFLPKDVAHASSQGLPVRVTDVKVKDKTLTLQVVPLDAGQRRELLKHIREPAKPEATPAATAPPPAGGPAAVGS